MTFGGKDVTIMKKEILNIVILFFVSILWAQEDKPIQKADSIHLKEVTVKDVVFCDTSIRLQKERVLLTANSLSDALGGLNIYLKKYGKGGLSSISLRGTDASHTNVYWNGVAINSNLNGQTDFSIIKNANIEAVQVQAVAGVADNAIGGNVKMTESIAFKKDTNLIAVFGLGSFQSYDGTLQGKYATEKWHTSFSYSAIESINDYTYYNSTIKNDNASYTTRNTAATLAYKLNNKQQIKFQVLDMLTDRNTARTLSATNNAHLELKNTIGLLNWNYKSDRQAHDLLFSIKDEKSNYQFDKAFDLYSKHKAQQYTLSYIPKFILDEKQVFTFYLANETVKASGDNILGAQTNLLKSKLQYQHTKDNFEYTLALGKDFSSAYEVPFLYRASAKLHLKNLYLSSSIASNYRLPTFNDLYWNPGGNPNLKSAYSFNAMLNLKLTIKNFYNSLTFFLINSKDLIKWRPVSGGMIWSPINVQRAQNYGLEYHAFYRIKNLSARFNYSYTKAVDLDLNKQLTYVPYHQARLNIKYAKYNKYSVSLLTAYTGKVFITTSNTQQLPAYLTTDLSFNYHITKPLQLRLELNNIFNAKYMAYADSPMPMQNFKLQIVYNPNFKQLNNNKNETNK
jgi:iron complex outermembrane receptor protein